MSKISFYFFGSFLFLRDIFGLDEEIRDDKKSRRPVSVILETGRRSYIV